jgi:hypothetical protein
MKIVRKPPPHPPPALDGTSGAHITNGDDARPDSMVGPSIPTAGHCAAVASVGPFTTGRPTATASPGPARASLTHHASPDAVVDAVHRF